MGADETFEAISHPIRIKILKLLAERSMGFSELKRALGIKSSGKLDFHMKKLGNLVTLDEEGKYTLTKEGYAALQAIDTVKRYGWQRRAYALATIAYVIAVIFTLKMASWNPIRPPYSIVLLLITLWYVFYSYWSIVRRGILKRY